MPRHAPKIAAFALASVALGSLLALTVPTDLRTAPNSKLDQLSAPQIASFPGAGHVIAGQDSYPVTYSPQYLAVAEQAERARLKQWDLAPVQDFGYGQPDRARDAAIEQEGVAQDTGEVIVRRGGQAPAAAPDQDPDDLALNEPPQG